MRDIAPSVRLVLVVEAAGVLGLLIGCAMNGEWASALAIPVGLIVLCLAILGLTELDRRYG